MYSRKRALLSVHLSAVRLGHICSGGDTSKHTHNNVKDIAEVIWSHIRPPYHSRTANVTEVLWPKRTSWWQPSDPTWPLLNTCSIGGSGSRLKLEICVLSDPNAWMSILRYSSKHTASIVLFYCLHQPILFSPFVVCFMYTTFRYTCYIHQCLLKDDVNALSYHRQPLV